MKKTIHFLMALALFVSSVGFAREPAGMNAGERLPPALRILLIEEMRAILEASQQIFSAIVQGQSELVVTQAQAIHDSFILAQKMTDEDRHTLHESVPHEFLALDEAFHKLSADLAEAARGGDQAAQQAIFQQMTESCVACHSRFASSRFPGLH